MSKVVGSCQVNIVGAGLGSLVVPSNGRKKPAPYRTRVENCENMVTASAAFIYLILFFQKLEIFQGSDNKDGGGG